MSPQLWLLAGGNGAGKSTFYRTRLQIKGMGCVNADDIAKSIDPGNPSTASYDAAKLAMNEYYDNIELGISFCYETVFSHESELEMLRAALDLDYHVVLVYLHLSNLSAHEARVAQRVSEGGHTVPVDKIYSRLPRTQRNIGYAAQLATEVLVFDNSSREQAFNLVAEKQANRITAHQDPLPIWASDILFPKQA